MSTVKMVVANKSNKQAMEEWEEFLLGISNSTTVDLNETEEEKRKRIAYLEKSGNEEKWIAHYFPKFAFCSPAKFQIKSTLRVLKAKRLYQRRAWARGLAKSTRRMFEIFYKIFVQKMRVNMLLISKNEGNAIRLLAPYRANLQANQRLINDYGKQMGSKWAEEEFVTRGKCSFRAVGMGQNPRGAKLDELRVNVLAFDDADDDEVCRNIERLDQNWEWVEKSAIPTVDISGEYFIFFDNNIIAEDSLAVRAAKYADDVETINIRDANGLSSWPEKNSEQDIADIEKKMSYEAFQGEYMNNPLSAGKTFPEMQWGKCPPISSLPFIEIYADPATSNKDKPSLKSNAQTSCKAVFVIGSDSFKYYIYYGFVNVMNNSDFIDCFYNCWLYAKAKRAKQVFNEIENNTLQDPFYQQLLLPLVFDKAKEYGEVLPISPDTRIKPDKWFRIEGNLEPLNRHGQLIFNIDEKENKHMLRLESQFKAAKSTSKILDGPDCIEGGVYKIKERISIQVAGAVECIKRPPNKKRY